MKTNMFRLMVCFALSLGRAVAADWYVNAAMPNDTGDGASWGTAKKYIQSAIDLAGVVAGDTVWVTNGVYDTGGRPHTGEALTNRVYINKAITVRAGSTNPANTLIKGRWNNPGGAFSYTNAIGDAAARCVYMAAGSKLIGFTLTNGATRASTGLQIFGGGICGSSSASVAVSNCVMTGNHAWTGGAGVYRATVYGSTMIRNIARPIWDGGAGGGASECVLHNCLLKGNSAGYSGGGAQSSTLYDCELLENRNGQYAAAADCCTLYNCNVTSNVGNMGGAISSSWDGVIRSVLYNCAVIGNTASSHGGAGRYSRYYNCVLANNLATDGGGAIGSILYNCLIVGNESRTIGGGTSGGQLYSCTVVGNSARQNAGGMFGGTAWNCIVYSNHSGSNNPAFHNYSNSVFNYSCTLPDPGAGDGNITNAPWFANPGGGFGTNHVSGDYRLSGGPGVNMGTNFGYMTDPATNEWLRLDLDGKPRIRHDIVDMGAYEIRVPKGTIFKGR